MQRWKSMGWVGRRGKYKPRGWGRGWVGVGAWRRVGGGWGCGWEERGESDMTTPNPPPHVTSRNTKSSFMLMPDRSGSVLLSPSMVASRSGNAAMANHLRGGASADCFCSRHQCDTGLVDWHGHQTVPGRLQSSLYDPIYYQNTLNDSTKLLNIRWTCFVAYLKILEKAGTDTWWRPLNILEILDTVPISTRKHEWIVRSMGT